MFNKNNSPFIKSSPSIKRRKNPVSIYEKMSAKELTDALHKSFTTKNKFDFEEQLKLLLLRGEEHEEILQEENERQKAQIYQEKKKSEQSLKMLEQQSKMAAVGEMMDAVAHQWKQPLNAISMLTDLLSSDYDDNIISKGYISTYVEDIQNQIEHMVSTLKEFRTFFRPNKDVSTFGLKRTIGSVLILTKDEFMKNQIEINILSDQEIVVQGIENEFKHLVINIINNAKDAFIEKETKNRTINIDFYKNKEGIFLEIADNAGGIPSNVINDIFKPNVTTKEQSNGTGIGLYMSTQIAHKMGGALSVKNVDDGAVFSLIIAN